MDVLHPMQDYLFNNQAKAFLDKWVLRLLLKLSTDLHGRISLGRALHNIDLATEKLYHHIISVEG